MMTTGVSGAGEGGSGEGSSGEGGSGVSASDDFIADFFVDSVNGSDANNGLTASTAKKTIAAVLALDTTHAKTFGLARGSSWREQFTRGAQGSEVNGTKVVAYGAGARPILDGADVLVAGNWSKTAGRTSVYQQSITLQASVFPKAYENWTVGGNPLIFVADIATCDSTPGSYHIPTVQSSSGNAGAGADTLYVHASDGSNPGSNGKTYELENRAFGLTLAGSGCAITGIEARRGCGHDGVIAIYNTGPFTGTDFVARLGGTHNMLVQPNTVLNQPQFIDNYQVFGTPSLLVCFSTADAGSNGLTIVGGGTTSGASPTWTNNVTLGNTPSPHMLDAHNGSGGQGAISISSVKATVGASAVALDSITTQVGTLTISGAYMNGCKAGVTCNTNAEVDDLQFITTVASSAAIIIGAGVSVTVKRPKFCTSSDQHGQIAMSGAGITLDVESGLFHDTSHTPSFNEGIIYGDSGTTGLALTVNNCQFSANDGGNFGPDPVAVYYIRGSLASYTGDNNAFYASGEGFPYFQVGATVYNAGTGLSDWVASGHPGFGQDAHSSVNTASAASACTPPA